MAIQGIINGFANPKDLSQFVLLVGRGPCYQVLVNGRQEGNPLPELEQAIAQFRTEAQRHCQGSWLRAAELCTSNCTGAAKVTQTRPERFDTYMAFADA